MSIPNSTPETASRSLAGRTILMSGGSRGIGLAIALRAAADGANIAMLAKTAEPHPKLEGTVYTAAEQLEAAGGKALPIIGDVRRDEDVARAVEATIEQFGGIDIVLNNASAIDLSGTDAVTMKSYDLMADINTRGTFMLSKFSLDALRRSDNGHILTLSPPLNLDPKWAGGYLAYTMAKYGMSLTTLGLAEELKNDGVAVNSLWPVTGIDTAAIRNMPGGAKLAAASRSTDIMADAAHAILTRPSSSSTGNFYTDEEVLREEGITDFSRYAPGVPADKLMPDFFL
ncbi:MULTISPECIES: NAD(P)-dependent oxidoreductase [unclassified Arthrobacter]|uniref:SDR family oxidoreductase n=1 Tax=unclassified Arthrobacter TaxID=235627 RepID=UPI001E4C2B7B|nr:MULTISPECIES: NAD(P)-dependent oxidoreductase [unclassified Arthrobacter]MCC9146177.1 NAD(P)-dependent oxidoreductase [Arthrobacter sp. zg-Y919]MDK1277407.1 NAD(P)-dependent oxidoreductase [Arthrobacter sp. zg.Y919]MDM7990455.1 NAD(P)-dependent oxidoreductase [Arthrobacter sp. zg-Y877]WIB03902.1 NAD(P)-dependent oxidoreductase [Arthrobacter sp. zg-Y919]